MEEDLRLPEADDSFCRSVDEDVLSLPEEEDFTDDLLEVETEVFLAGEVADTWQLKFLLN